MIVALDPGKETGWARLSVGYDTFASGQLPWYDALYFIHETLKQGFKPIIVCEDFIYTRETLKKSRQVWSTEGIGVLRFLTHQYECEFILQTPSAAKSFATNTKLKKIGWYKPGKDHANDAARHLMVYAVGHGLIPVHAFKEDHADSRD